MKRKFIVVVLAATAACSSGVKISSDEYVEGAWPFKAKTVIVDCEQTDTGPYMTVNIDGLDYALGYKTAQQRGLVPAFRPTYPSDPVRERAARLKNDGFNAIIERGKKICSIGSRDALRGGQR